MTKFSGMTTTEFLNDCASAQLTTEHYDELIERLWVVADEERTAADLERVRLQNKIEEAQMDLRDAERRLERLQAL